MKRLLNYSLLVFIGCLIIIQISTTNSSAVKPLGTCYKCMEYEWPKMICELRPISDPDAWSGCRQAMEWICDEYGIQCGLV